jgi:hypothetical protein
MEKQWVIVQYDNRVIKDTDLKLIDINKNYCLKHGYKHILETKPYYMPPWWIKVKLVKDILSTNNYKGALWLDTDAVIHNQEMCLDNLIKKDKSMYYSGDPPFWDAEFNAGVWLIKNDIYGKEILEKWINSYSPKDWAIENNKWITSGEWAGSTYEQGAFLKYVKPNFEQYVYIYPWQVFQSYEPDVNTFTLHFAGDLYDKYLPAYINQIYYRYIFGKILLCLLIIMFCTTIINIYLLYPTHLLRFYKTLKIFKITDVFK